MQLFQNIWLRRYVVACVEWSRKHVYEMVKACVRVVKEVTCV